MLSFHYQSVGRLEWIESKRRGRGGGDGRRWGGRGKGRGVVEGKGWREQKAPPRWGTFWGLLFGRETGAKTDILYCHCGKFHFQIPPTSHCYKLNLILSSCQRKTFQDIKCMLCFLGNGGTGTWGGKFLLIATPLNRSRNPSSHFFPCFVLETHWKG